MRASLRTRRVRPTQRAELAHARSAAVLADGGVLDAHALEQPERLRVVASGDVHLVAARAQALDDRPEHERVRGRRHVEPHPPSSQSAGTVAGVAGRIVLFGATGYTGRLTADALLQRGVKSGARRA